MKPWALVAAIFVEIAGLGLAFTGVESKAASPTSTALPPVPTEPQTTTASYGDWTVRCATVGGKRQCEATLSLAVVQQNRQIPIAQIAFGRSSEAPGALQVTALLPVNVGFDKAARIGVDDSHLITLVYRRCVPAGCLASAAADMAIITLARTTSKPGRLVFADASERMAILPVSFRGLAQALSALAQER